MKGPRKTPAGFRSLPQILQAAQKINFRVRAAHIEAFIRKKMQNPRLPRTVLGSYSEKRGTNHRLLVPSSVANEFVSFLRKGTLKAPVRKLVFFSDLNPRVSIAQARENVASAVPKAASAVLSRKAVGLALGISEKKVGQLVGQRYLLPDHYGRVWLSSLKRFLGSLK